MSLIDMLRALGDRLGILEIESTPHSSRPTKIQTRRVGLKELTTEIYNQEVRLLAELPAELSVALDQIFDAAGIKPAAHGWTIERLKQLLRTDQLRSLDRAAVQRAIVNILEDEKVEIADLVKDAVARDQALDAFEAFARTKMDARMAAREKRLAEIGAQLRELHDEQNRLREESARDEGKWRQWREKKRAAERELAWAIGYLIDTSVVTED